MTKQEAEEYLVAVLLRVPLRSSTRPGRRCEGYYGVRRNSDISSTNDSDFPPRPDGGPDPSIGQQGKVFGINIHELKATEELCVPLPEMMPIKVKKHIGKQMLDMLSFPRAVTMSESEKIGNTGLYGQ
jgi:hypothetical protein